MRPNFLGGSAIMKKIKGRTAHKNKKKPSSAGKTSDKPADLADIRQQITNLVGTHAIAMVETTIGEVDKGHYAAMKYLFELVGLSSAVVTAEPQGQDVLAKTLLQRLREAEIPTSVNTITKDSEVALQGIAEHPVE